MEVKVCVFILNKQSSLLLDYFQKCFFWLWLKKIVVWFLCYRENFLEVRKSNKLDCEVLKYIIFEEMGRVEKEILKYVQRKVFLEELSYVEKLVKKSSCLYKFNLFIVDNFLCVGG